MTKKPKKPATFKYVAEVVIELDEEVSFASIKHAVVAHLQPNGNVSRGICDARGRMATISRARVRSIDKDR